MQYLKNLLVLLGVVAGFAASAQQDSTILNYIDTYKDLAISEMQRTGVPASIKLAQGIHETMAGTSDLVKMSNNHFGIKCKSNWSGPSVSHDDDLRNECFRKYDQAADSYRDHSDFLRGSSRYAPLFKLDPLDYKDWAYGLKKAGYATNPRYPQVIIKLIEDYHLQDYSLIALGKIQPKEEVAVAVPPVQEEVVNHGPAPEEIIPIYPSGEFRINNTRVIYARKETSLLSIAQQYDVSLSRLYEFNEMNEVESLDRDQLIYLQRKRKMGASEFHTVKPGETLADIARIEGIRLESLAEYNHLDPGMQPAAGEQLSLRNARAGSPKLAKKEAVVKE